MGDAMEILSNMPRQSWSVGAGDYGRYMLGKMAEYASGDDAEISHKDADNLLIEALQHYVPESDRADIESAIERYENMKRWYA